MCLQYKTFENTVGKGEIMSNFSFSYSVFYPSEELFTISVKFQIVVCNPFQYGCV